MYDDEEHQKLMIKKTMEYDGQKIRTNSSNGDDDRDDVPLPGFRFHPTDEELVGFYLRRKVEKKSISIELIKQIDIYKYDPWDLPKASNVGDKEWYFFCKRGRKYRNSIRPNRVTGSGFWKATGIDRPIYSGGGDGRDCIGLKKSLVYYRGSAGKGTKTDWMMHEFRLPTDNEKTTKHVHVKTVTQEAAEVWTLCRILKRNVSYRKCMPEWKDLSGGGGKRMNKLPVLVDSSGSKTCSSFDSTEDSEKYISFNNAAPLLMNMQIRAAGNNYMKPFTSIYTAGQVNNNSPSYINSIFQSSYINEQQEEEEAAAADADFIVKQADWDELRSIVEYGGGVISPF